MASDDRVDAKRRIMRMTEEQRELDWMTRLEQVCGVDWRMR